MALNYSSLGNRIRYFRKKRGLSQMALAEAGIQLYAGVTGSADAAAKAFAAGSLKYNPDARCDHHDRHNGEGHDCGSHGCGEHSCHKA